MSFVLSAQMLWPDGTTGEGEEEVVFSPDATDAVTDFICRQTAKIGTTGEDGMKCDAIDLTLSEVVE